MHPFVSGLIGGAIIGLSAAILLLVSGDILGASGIVSSIGLNPIGALQDAAQHWKIVWMASFFLTAHLFLAPYYEDKNDAAARLSWTAYLIGGFFVGFGTRLGNGCTSGHGICGLARFSKRSFVSVCVFMSIGFLTASLTQASALQDAFAFLRDDDQEEFLRWDMLAAAVAMVLCAMAFAAASFYTEDASYNARRKLAPAALVGALFAAGLYVSGMVYPMRVMNFLNIALLPTGEWDATLMFVMGGGVIISFAAYQVVDGHSILHKYFPPLSKPLYLCDGSNFSVPSNTIIDRDLVLGAMCFGLGWGISGLCPGPAMVLAAVGVSWVLVCYWPAFFLGAFVAGFVKGRSCCSSANEEPVDHLKHSEGGKTCQSSVEDSKHEKNKTQPHGSTAIMTIDFDGDDDDDDVDLQV